MYYPKSQIKTNLYTNGGEYVIKSSGRDYIGFYYKLSNGELYVGKQPQRGGGVQLIIPPNPPVTPEDYKENEVRVALFVDDPDPIIEEGIDGLATLLYTNLIEGNGINIDPRTTPPPYYPQQTLQEIKTGEYRRYFAKKTNEFIYIEISKLTYIKFKSNDSTVASDLYECLSLPWSTSTAEIGGAVPGVVNRKIVYSIENNMKWYGFYSYFRGQFG